MRELELATLKLESAELKLEAELRRLRGQLEPHFLLNTLNLLSGLVGVDVPKARHTLGCLGDLLRDALTNRAEVHTVAEELDWLRRYVELLEIRHGDALRVVWEVEAATLPQLVPRLVLQPILENAVHHGALQRRDGQVRFALQALDGGRLRCSIVDNGPGIPAAARGTGIGLRNSRRRLELSAPGSTVTLDTSPSGTTATLVWHPAALEVRR
jgi:sensor histidine kinase YesM